MEERDTEARLAKLEASFQTIVQKQNQEEVFRTEIYAYQRDQAQHDARMDEKIKSMDEKLDTLISWQEDQKQKPAKRWDDIIDKIMWFFIGSILAYIIARVGLQ